MKFLKKILVLLISLLLSIQIFSQTNTSHSTEIKAFKGSIDSLYNIYDSLHHILNDTAAALLEDLKLGESIGEGVYYEEPEKNVLKTEGGFSVLYFCKS